MDDNPSTAPNAVSRRSLLLSGLGAAGIGLGLGACSSGRASPLAGPTHDVVGTEPPPPVDHTSYVTRPDLTPPGVAVRTAAAWSASKSRFSYIFCAPKSPLAANPGHVGGHHGFPAGATPGLMILDTAGELVWFKPLPSRHQIPCNFRVQTYKSNPTLTWFEGTLQGGHAIGRYILADNTYRQIGEVTTTDYPCDLHEFILTPEGTALHTAYETGAVSRQGVPLIIGHAQEVDVATNQLLLDWPSYPTVSPDLSYTHPYGDYFHINSIGLWPGSARNLLISSRDTCAIYLIDRQTKRVIWRLGGKRSDFAMGPGTPFYFQHDARALADGSGLSLFDDASQPSPEKVASGKVLTLDKRARRATLKHRYFHADHEFDTPSQGNCQLLADAGHVVGWGFLPFFSVYGSSSDAVLEAPLLLDGRFPKGADSYRTFLFDWTGHPSPHELRLVVRPGAGSGAFTAWVSWNGATEVVAWRLRAGPSVSSLEPVKTVKKSSFETKMDFTRDRANVFDVAAFNSSGRMIGRSPTVQAD
jgi:hypothetical protein